MQRIKSFFNSEIFAPNFILILIGGLVYLIFIPGFGYFNDDWYLMYAAGAMGPGVFKDIFIVDRPMRALVMSPAYWLFGNNPMIYNLSAWGLRVLSAIIFFWLLQILWPRQKKIAWMSALLYLIYPGFLSQFNGIDYQSQMVSLAVGMLSLLLLVYAYRSPNSLIRSVSFVFLIVTTTFYLGLVEYFIGFEILKLAIIALLVFRDEAAWQARVKRFTLWMFYSLFAAFPFLVWRLFFFHGERGATDVNVKFSDILSNPMASLLGWSSTLLKNMSDVSIAAWIIPLRRISYRLSADEWYLGVLMAILILVLVWLALKRFGISKDGWTDSHWRMQAIWLGVIMVVFGLLPVILVGRYVDFRSFSRYALAPSIGVILLWMAGLDFISNARFRNVLFGLLVVSSSLTHYANALVRIQDTQAMRTFWWQVSWRIPQMEQGTTLVAHYPSITIEEDYFVWGPANLIYYPDSTHVDYAQPGIYSLLMNQETIEKVLAHEPQDFSNRRSIRTYPNYRNILIVTQPTLDSCIQIIDGMQPEFSSSEDTRFKQVGSFSETEHILIDESFRQPPAIPFGQEPVHDWCYIYEKAAFARQLGDWDEVLELGEQAFDKGLSPKDEIEWMPLLEAYTISGNLSRMTQINDHLKNPFVREQACRILSSMVNIAPEIHIETQKLFCNQ